MYRKLFHFILFLSGCFLGIQAQTNQFASSITLTRLTQDDGLSQGSNYFRYEDQLGFMWITGIDALNRYDGKMVKVYNLRKYFKACEPLQQGYGFAEDAEHNLYVGSARGLYIYHRKKDQFSLKKIFSGPDPVAMPICYTGGKVWCFNRYWQIATYDVSTRQVAYQTQLQLDSISSIHNYASSSLFYYRYPFIDKSGRIWCISGNDIQTLNCQTLVVDTPLRNHFRWKNTLFYNCLFDSLQNRIYLTTSGGLWEYTIPTKAIRRIRTHANRQLDQLPYIVIYKNLLVCRDANSRILIIDLNTDRVVFEEKRKPYQFYASYCFGFDRSGRLWMCDDGRGQIIVDFQPKLLNKEPGSLLLSASSFYGGVSSLGEMPDGSILLNHPEIFTPARTFTLAPKVYAPLAYFRKTLDTVRNGVWMYAENSGDGKVAPIQFVNHQHQATLKLSEEELQSPGRIKDLQVLPDGRMLLSPQRGLSWLYPEKKQIKRIDALPDADPFKICPISRDRVAVSYINHSMRLIQLSKNDEVEVIKTILPGVQSFYLQEDIRRKRYWVGSNQGIYLLDSLFKPIYKFDANNQLAGTNIYGLLLDDYGTVWCSHQHGLSSIDASTLQVINYNKEDGIQDWDYNNRSFLKARDGTLYFGGVSGFNYFKPPLLQQSYYKPTVYVDEIRVNNQTWFPDSNANEINTLDLTVQQNNISINALVRDLSRAKSRQITYRLIPVDSAWKTLPENSLITLNYLGPGSYQLEIGYTNKYEGLIKSGKIIRIEIARPYYASWWFWTLLTITFQSILGVWIYRYQKRKQTRKKEKELASIQLASLEQQAFSSLMNPHFMFNSLNSVQHYINLQDRQNANRYLTDFASLIRKNFEAAQRSFIGLEQEIEHITLYLRLEKMRFSHRFNYQILIDEEVDPEEWMIPSMILQPLIENALLHGLFHDASEGIIQVSFKLWQGHLSIRIIDNGIGIAQSKALKAETPHRSRGMELIRKRIQALSHFSRIPITLNYSAVDERLTNPGTHVHLIFPQDLYENWARANKNNLPGVQAV